jgi:inner membrane transporter RhtA
MRSPQSGVALMLSSSASNQSGAALGALAFPAIGAVGVVAVRQLVVAGFLVPLARPRLRSYTPGQLRPVLALAAVFGVMNLSLYAAIDRIGLALAVTLEFLGPMAVALASSRRVRDVLCAVLALGGVVAITGVGSSSDLLGIALALVAATAWALYILLNRVLGERLPGVQGPAAASLVSATVWIPISLLWFNAHPPTASATVLAICCGFLASVVPYVADLAALRFVSRHAFSVFTSTNPVWAALAGWVVLRQSLDLHELAGVALVVTASVTASTPV